MPSSWPAMLNLGAVVCLGGGVLIFPLWRRLLGKRIDKRQALLLSNTMVYLTPDESFSTNAQVPAANPIAGTENYSIGEKKGREQRSTPERKGQWNNPKGKCLASTWYVPIPQTCFFWTGLSCLVCFGNLHCMFEWHAICFKVSLYQS